MRENLLDGALCMQYNCIRDMLAVRDMNSNSVGYMIICLRLRAKKKEVPTRRCLIKEKKNSVC